MVAKKEITYNGKPYVSTSQAAKMLGFKSVKAIYSRIDDKTFSSTRKGKYWYVLKSDITTLSPNRRGKQKSAKKSSRKPTLMQDKSLAKIRSAVARYNGQLDLDETTKRHKTHHPVHPTVSLTVAVTQCYAIGMGQKDIEALVGATMIAIKQHPTMM